VGRNRFVKPETTTLELSEGDWIEVKLRLTNGERRQMNAAGLARTLKQQTPGSDQEIGVDWPEFAIARAMAWIVDWSFTDVVGNRIPFSRNAYLAIDTESADEIDAALDKHIEERDRPNVTTPGSTSEPPTIEPGRESAYQSVE